MAEYLFIRFAQPPGEAAWAALDAEGRLLAPVARGPLAEARPAAEGRRVVLLTPGPDVILTQTVLPAASQARLRQMLPYSLEETLAADVDDLVFAVGARGAGGAVAVAVVARERLEQWLAELGQAQIPPHAVYSEADGVPAMPGTLTLLIEGERIYGRRGNEAPFVFDGLPLRNVIELVQPPPLDEEAAAPLERLFIYTDEPGRVAHAADLLEIRESQPSTEMKFLPQGAFAHLAATLARRPGTNLLQGRYSPKSNWLALLQPWRAAAALLAGLLVLGLALQAAQFFALQREDSALADLVANGCRQIGAGQLADCQADVRQRLGNSGAADVGAGFLTTLAAVADSRDQETTIEALSYRNRVMDLQLLAASVPALDAFAREVGSTNRFEARIESQSLDDEGKVQGRVQVVEVRR